MAGSQIECAFNFLERLASEPHGLPMQNNPID